MSNRRFQKSWISLDTLIWTICIFKHFLKILIAIETTAKVIDIWNYDLTIFSVYNQRTMICFSRSYKSYIQRKYWYPLLFSCYWQKWETWHWTALDCLSWISPTPRSLPPMPWAPSSVAWATSSPWPSAGVTD